jgi:hypothetical protein
VIAFVQLTKTVEIATAGCGHQFRVRVIHRRLGSRAVQTFPSVSP